MSEKRTELKDLGEFKLIDKLTNSFESKNSSTLKGIGDDAAVLKFEDEIVVSTDLLVEGIHFDLTYAPLKHLGYKATTVNISDIVAMNATPTQITVSIAASNRFSVEALEELYAGIKRACDVYSVDLIGGDTTSSTSGLMISITAIGTAKKESLTYRNGAKEGDLLVVTGDLGGAYMGLQVLEREKYVFKDAPQLQPDLVGFDYILERQLKPEARIDITKLLVDLNLKPTSMIDVSDGLASEIFHITKQSDVGCQLYEEKIPIDTETYSVARDFELDPTLCALSGGEDYELLFTISQSDYEKIKNLPDFSIIGHITDKQSGNMMVTKNGVIVPLKAQGWDGIKDNLEA